MDHGGVSRGFLSFALADLLAVAVNQFRFCTEWSMHGELPIIHEKRLGSVATCQPMDGLLCHAIFDVLSRFPFFKIRVGVAPGSQVAILGTGTMPMWKVHIKTHVQRCMRFQPQVPLPKVCRRIPLPLQHLTQGRQFRIEPGGGLDVGTFLMWKSSCTRNRLKLLHRKMSRGSRHPMPGRILATEDTCPCR